MIIDQLPELTNIFDTDEIPIERGTNTYKTKISTFFSGLRDLIAAKVSKSGDTMTGHLDIVNANVQINSNGMEDNVPGTANYFGRGVYCRDKNSVEVGTCRPFSGASGTIEDLQGMQLTAARTISGTKIENLIRLAIDSEGHLAVLLSSAVPWRKALGLGTNGALPITVAQGGSGQTASSSESVASNIATSAAPSNTEVVSAYFASWGKVATVQVGIKRTIATGANTDVTVATLVNGKKPKTTSPASIRYSDSVNFAYINSSGGIVINTATSIPANTTFYINATYIMA